jgi:hypothetical protein
VSVNDATEVTVVLAERCSALRVVGFEHEYIMPQVTDALVSLSICFGMEPQGLTRPRGVGCRDRISWILPHWVHGVARSIQLVYAHSVHQTGISR